MTSKRILICPLDWGIGHATRTIPLAKRLQAKGHTIIIAAQGKPLLLLRQHFPQQQYIELQGYNIWYTRKLSMALAMLLQSPKILWRIYTEHKALKQIVPTHNIDIVISDSRFGLFHKSAHTIFVAHQLAVRMPTGLQWLQLPVYWLMMAIVNQYKQLWIPDFEQGILSGKLTQQYKLPTTAKYIGPLSRFYTTKAAEDSNYKADLLILLSGIEPQRTMLEDLLLKQLQGKTLSVLLVRGIASEHSPAMQQQGNLRIVDFVDTGKLAYAIQTAQYIVCRSGYSTIMDLVALQRTAILVATPGQTEQEYLAEYLSAKNWFYSQAQNKLDIMQAMHKSEAYSLPSNWPDANTGSELL